MGEKKSFMDKLDAKRDAIAEKLEKKELEIPADLIAGILFFVLGVVVLLIMPYQVDVAVGDVVDGRAFPKLLMILMMVASGALIVKELYRVLVEKKPLEKKKINLLVEVKALEILAILLVTYILCRVTDLFVIGACVCSLGFLVYFRCRKKSYYAITLTAAVLIWVAFRFGLGVSF